MGVRGRWGAGGRMNMIDGMGLFFEVALFGFMLLGVDILWLQSLICCIGGCI